MKVYLSIDTPPTFPGTSTRLEDWLAVPMNIQWLSNRKIPKRDAILESQCQYGPTLIMNPFLNGLRLCLPSAAIYTGRHRSSRLLLTGYLLEIIHSLIGSTESEFRRWHSCLSASDNPGLRHVFYLVYHWNLWKTLQKQKNVEFTDGRSHKNFRSS